MIVDPMIPPVTEVARVAVAWLLTYAIHSTLLLGAVWLLARTLVRGPGLRDVLWKAALVGGVATASLQVAGLGSEPRVDLSVLHAAAAEGGAHGPAGARELAQAQPTHAAAPLRVAPWTVVLLALWAAGAGACLVRYAGARIRLALRLRGRRPVEDAAAGGRLTALCEAAGIPGHVRLSCSEGIETPIALGLREICIPPRALSLSPECQTAMLAHELAHLRRRDPLWLWAAGLLECAFFFQPLHRIGRRHWMEASEYLCDDWAVQHIGRGVVLARCLVEVADWVRTDPRPLPLPLAGMAEGPSGMAKRVERLLGDPDRRRSSAPCARALAIALLACATLGGPRVAIARPAAPRPVLAAVPAAARAFCWKNDERSEANPRCSVTLQTRDGRRMRLSSAAIRRADHPGYFRVEEGGGTITLRRLEVAAIGYNNEDPGVLLLEVPADRPMWN